MYKTALLLFVSSFVFVQQSCFTHRLLYQTRPVFLSLSSHFKEILPMITFCVNAMN